MVISKARATVSATAKKLKGDLKIIVLMYNKSLKLEVLIRNIKTKSDEPKVDMNSTFNEPTKATEIKQIFGGRVFELVFKNVPCPIFHLGLFSYIGILKFHVTTEGEGSRQTHKRTHGGGRYKISPKVSRTVRFRDLAKLNLLMVVRF